MPNRLSVSCPRCKREAAFEPPFEFFKSNDSEPKDLIRWNNILVRARFASVFPWADKDNLFKSLFWGTSNKKPSDHPIRGIIICAACTLLRKHERCWPRDAFFAVPIDGQVLWAWDRESFITIRDHIAATMRPDRTHPILKYLPRHFLAAKRRASGVKAINELLVATA